MTGILNQTHHSGSGYNGYVKLPLNGVAAPLPVCQLTIWILSCQRDIQFVRVRLVYPPVARIYCKITKMDDPGLARPANPCQHQHRIMP